jgi:K(+)-stimulated pyrophosphate-energized sodium pump
MLVAGLALLGVAVYYYILTGPMALASDSRQVIDALVALGFGASLISIFARLGGGIFTKGADVGGDLVGKVEAGIPGRRSAQPGYHRRQCRRQRRRLRRHGCRPVRNLCGDRGRHHGSRRHLLCRHGYPGLAMLYPLAICGASIITSIIGTFFVKLGTNGSIMGALYKGLIVTGVPVIGLGGATSLTIGWGEIAVIDGKSITGTNLFSAASSVCRHRLIVVITEYYTGTNKRPVNSIARRRSPVTAPT